ncbi:MAG: ATP-binding protein [Lachnospiraceae bacterium]|nr:ATP-binding protein [Lachnospiraceae bacterium]
MEEKAGNRTKGEQISVDAVVENIDVVTDFVNEKLEQYGCPMKAQMQIDIAIDELFGNIAHYAYHPGVGPATVRVEVSDWTVFITFIDHGIPYDPLSGKDPDITLSAEEREIGGLGIYMVKKSMDDISYEYKDGQNILRVKKHIDGSGMKQNPDVLSEEEL